MGCVAPLPLPWYTRKKSPNAPWMIGGSSAVVEEAQRERFVDTIRVAVPLHPRYVLHLPCDAHSPWMQRRGRRTPSLQVRMPEPRGGYVA